MGYNTVLIARILKSAADPDRILPGIAEMALSGAQGIGGNLKNMPGA